MPVIRWASRGPCLHEKLRAWQFTRCSRSSRWYSSANAHIHLQGRSYKTDEWSNIPSSIFAKLALKSPLDIPNHPLAILKQRIENSIPDFDSLTTTSPIVSVTQNFDDLGFPQDHPGRSKTDSYYINKDTMLQTHTSAHEVSTFSSGRPKWLLTADVYRRDEIDASHYPVFHQMEGARVIPSESEALESLSHENNVLASALARKHLIIEDTSSITSSNPYQACHDPVTAELVSANLKLTLNKVIVDLFASDFASSQDSPLRVRWIDAYFPFTSPSYEVEVMFGGKWLEILGCGVVNHSTLTKAGRFSLI